MSTKQERINQIGESGGTLFCRSGYQDYMDDEGIICLDGYYTSQQLRDIADVMDAKE